MSFQILKNNTNKLYYIHHSSVQKLASLNSTLTILGGKYDLESKRHYFINKKIPQELLFLINRTRKYNMNNIQFDLDYLYVIYNRNGNSIEFFGNDIYKVVKMMDLSYNEIYSYQSGIYYTGENNSIYLIKSKNRSTRPETNTPIILIIENISNITDRNKIKLYFTSNPRKAFDKLIILDKKHEMITNFSNQLYTFHFNCVESNDSIISVFYSQLNDMNIFLDNNYSFLESKGHLNKIQKFKLSEHIKNSLYQLEL